MAKADHNGVAGKWFLCLIGASVLLLGVLFEWLMIRSYQHAKESREWPQVQAVVLRSSVGERRVKGSPAEYRLEILYGYSYEGKDLTSDRLSPRGAKWMKDEDAVLRLAAEYPVGSEHTVWVNPAQHDMAIMKHDTKAAGYTIWFPALFIIGGAGMIWGALREREVRS